MGNHFHHVVLMGRKNQKATKTLLAVAHYLENRVSTIAVPKEIASLLKSINVISFENDKLPENTDLIIVVGGDGSLLNAATTSLSRSIPVLGINRGYLGFLTDIHPDEITRIDRILEGEYQLESRFLLSTNYVIDNTSATLAPALNDIVLLPGEAARMIAFDIYIDDQFVCHQRADGIIIATPTGSTAYALSGGGPILHPSLDAIALVPMFPHTLTSRPIVVSSNANILIKISKFNQAAPSVSADGKTRVTLPPGSTLSIKKHNKSLRLLHPNNYEYFKTLREKLDWEKRSTNHTG